MRMRLNVLLYAHHHVVILSWQHGSSTFTKRRIT